MRLDTTAQLQLAAQRVETENRNSPSPLVAGRGNKNVPRGALVSRRIGPRRQIDKSREKSKIRFIEKMTSRNSLKISFIIQFSINKKARHSD